ncbi:GAD-like domain-containing protein [Salmonella bongori]|uniref:GAD-like domain-containing protein n=1 Tax=Salmonella bongori TaxID=54736 RepID=UPI0009AA01B7|nr:GAD-like domain-containing protein [Salmonella bongori]
MRDEDFSYFIKKFGEATSSVIVPEGSINKWKNILPNKLLDYWKTEGWGIYRNGLFSLVNPEEYEDILDIWLEDTRFEEMDSYHVIAKTAFGELYAWGESTGRNITIQPLFNQIIYNKSNFIKKTTSELNSEIESFFAFSSVDEFDLSDGDGNYLFDKAIEKYGILADNEMFGLEPAYILGGNLALGNLIKLNCQVHLMILRELAPPKIIQF